MSVRARARFQFVRHFVQCGGFLHVTAVRILNRTINRMRPALTKSAARAPPHSPFKRPGSQWWPGKNGKHSAKIALKGSLRIGSLQGLITIILISVSCELFKMNVERALRRGYEMRGEQNDQLLIAHSPCEDWLHLLVNKQVEHVVSVLLEMKWRSYQACVDLQ